MYMQVDKRHSLKLKNETLYFNDKCSSKQSRSKYFQITHTSQLDFQTQPQLPQETYHCLKKCATAPRSVSVGSKNLRIGLSAAPFFFGSSRRVQTSSEANFQKEDWVLNKTLSKDFSPILQRIYYLSSGFL